MQSKCGIDAVRLEADHLAPHQNPAEAMNRAAMAACPSGYDIVQTQSLVGGSSVVWSVRCSVWDKPASFSPSC